MPHLPYETITQRVIRPSDLDRLVSELGGRSYDTASAVGSDFQFQVEGNFRDAKSTRRWMALGGEAPQVLVLLNALAHQGLIEDGTYQIKH